MSKKDAQERNHVGAEKKSLKRKGMWMFGLIVSAFFIPIKVLLMDYHDGNNLDDLHIIDIDSVDLKNDEIDTSNSLDVLQNVTTDKSSSMTPSIRSINSSNIEKKSLLTNSNPGGISSVSNASSPNAKQEHSFENATNAFKRYDGVVIVTKVLEMNSVKNLKKIKSWLCFLSHSYNHKMKYDIVIFTTMPWKDDEISQLQKIAEPAKLTVTMEAPPLEEQLAKIPKDELLSLRKRCGIEHDDNQTLTWYHHCTEEGHMGINSLGYAWQAEFRSYHIWTHPAIQKYKYMMWLDSDAYVGKEWDVDPMQAMVENDLAILYGGFPYGTTTGDYNLRDKLIHAYGTSICATKWFKGSSRNGKILNAVPCTDNASFMHIGGAHHITNLDVYRKEVHQQFLKNFTGDYRFSRLNDDQVSVTILIQFCLVEHLKIFSNKILHSRLEFMVSPFRKQ